MSLLRNVSGREAVKAFIRAGGVARHGKGDHVKVIENGIHDSDT